ncbi:glycosyltransferase family 25 protein [Asaia astilbis]|uniref:glycosyltransferase family 25 protein n=1 Tax=Asaia astilbis TaxID=610244 RepID=UPI0004725634|nr:glycosyltransferase family 25 protein [Asaia astilbis]
MDKFFISLERTPERKERFLAVNAHIGNFIHAPGIDGSLMDIASMKELGLIHANCNFTRGALGSGLTHVALWGSVAKSGRAAHIFEDDAFLCKNFEEESARIILGLGDDWDIILWGNNPDTTLKFTALPGITPCTVTLSQPAVRENILRFAKSEIKSLPFRLDHTFGICGYAVSPKGANRLLETCLPLRGEIIKYDSLGGKELLSSSVDHLMNLFYRSLQAYTSFPPLCLTDNRAEHSLNR